MSAEAVYHLCLKLAPWPWLTSCPCTSRPSLEEAVDAFLAQAGLRPSAVHSASTANLIAKLPRNDVELHQRVEAAYWAALNEATSAADGEARLRHLVAELERPYPSAAACLAEDLPALCTHLEYPYGSASVCARPTFWSDPSRR